MRTKHLIRAFTKQGATRPQAIKFISNGRRYGLKNKQILERMYLSVSFSHMTKVLAK